LSRRENLEQSLELHWANGVACWDTSSVPEEEIGEFGAVVDTILSLTELDSFNCSIESCEEGSSTAEPEDSKVPGQIHDANASHGGVHELLCQGTTGWMV
jgi:hypothetical protein